MSLTRWIIVTRWTLANAFENPFANENGRRKFLWNLASLTLFNSLTAVGGFGTVANRWIWLFAYMSLLLLLDRWTLSDGRPIKDDAGKVFKSRFQFPSSNSRWKVLNVIKLLRIKSTRRGIGAEIRNKAFPKLYPFRLRLYGRPLSLIFNAYFWYCARFYLFSTFYMYKPSSAGKFITLLFGLLATYFQFYQKTWGAKVGIDATKTVVLIRVCKRDTRARCLRVLHAIPQVRVGTLGVN